MTRIVAGAARGRRLKVPAGGGTRPTSDRVREALFSSLAAEFGTFHGLRVLDLYAGSGALGLEALSRGAAHALLVEADGKALEVIKANVAAVGMPGAEVRAGTVERALALPPALPYDIVLLDPPYDFDDVRLGHDLTALADGWLATDSVVVVERDRRSGSPPWPEGIVADRERRYGETMLWYGRSAR